MLVDGHSSLVTRHPQDAIVRPALRPPHSFFIPSQYPNYIHRMHAPAPASHSRPYAFVPALSSACGASCGRSFPLLIIIVSVFPPSLNLDIPHGHMRLVCRSTVPFFSIHHPFLPPPIPPHRLSPFAFPPSSSPSCLFRQIPGLEERTYRYILATLGRLSVYIHKLRRLQEQETQDMRRSCTMHNAVCCLDIHMLL